VPVKIINEPTAPFAGLKLVNVGVANTVKSGVFTVTPLVVTDMGPSDAPAGTVTVMVVDEPGVTLTGAAPVNCTVAGAVKFVPVMVTIAPTAPLAGLIPVMVGV